MRIAKLLLTATAALAFIPSMVAASDDAARVSLRMSNELSNGLVSAAPPVGASASPGRVAPKPVMQGTKDYRIGPEDLIEIQVFGVDQLTRTVRVNSRGNISL